MPNYRIESTAGVPYGVYNGASPADALLCQHRDAGYGSDKVWCDRGELRFADDEYRQMLGDVEDWHITEVEA